MLREETAGSRVRASRARSRRGDLAPPSTGQAAAGDAKLLGSLGRGAPRSRASAACRPMSCCTTPRSTASPASRPTTLTQLRGIPGIGDKKLEHYGDELIALVNAAPH